MNCRVLFEYGLFLTHLGNQETKALHFLNEALYCLILNASTHSKCRSLKVLGNFQSLGQREKLDYIGNGTRELAHCVYEIGKLLRETDKSLSQDYYKKAHQLGMQFVFEAGRDSYTQVTILTEIGQALENEAFLKGALKILQYSFGREMKEKLRTEIMVSVIECAGQERGDALHEHQKQLELELNGVIVESKLIDSNSPEFTGGKITDSLLQSKRNDAWYTIAIKALKKLPKDLTVEETELLRDLRERFMKVKKDTIVFKKFETPCDEASQTETSVSDAFAQTEEKSMQPISTQTRIPELKTTTTKRFSFTPHRTHIHVQTFQEVKNEHAQTKLPVQTNKTPEILSIIIKRSHKSVQTFIDTKDELVQTKLPDLTVTTYKPWSYTPKRNHSTTQTTHPKQASTSAQTGR